MEADQAAANATSRTLTGPAAQPSVHQPSSESAPKKRAASEQQNLPDPPITIERSPSSQPAAKRQRAPEPDLAERQGSGSKSADHGTVPPKQASQPAHDAAAQAASRQSEPEHEQRTPLTPSAPQIRAQPRSDQAGVPTPQEQPARQGVTAHAATTPDGRHAEIAEAAPAGLCEQPTTHSEQVSRDHMLQYNAAAWPDPS